jgi:membrane protease YdiL (CAAX protease family)
MTNLPEDDAHDSMISPGDDSAGVSATPAFNAAHEPAATPSSPQVNPDANLDADRAASAPASSAFSYTPPSYIPVSSPDQPLFYSYAQPPIRRPVRIPHFGHLMLLLLLLGVAATLMLAFTAAAYALALHFHPSVAQNFKNAATDIRLNLLVEAVLYLITLGFSLIVFPRIWNESFFTGLQWRGAVALSRFLPLATTASGCFALAWLDEVVMPGPTNAPIEKMISSPGAAWLMFAFGVTMAPFFEEMFFRGFLLPSLSTAYDWTAEKIKHTPPRPLDANGCPQWSLAAMVTGSVLTSIPFALLHVEQQGHSLGPFLLLIVISLILCGVRLVTRSLAASTLVHASYNFFIFALTLVATGGFRHFDKM